MVSRRRRRLLVPEAREAMEQLKYQVLVEKGAPTQPSSAPAARAPAGFGAAPVAVSAARSASPASVVPAAAPAPGTVASVARAVGVPYQPAGDNGEMTTRQAGKIGGEIGGSMVKRLISIAEQQLAERGTKPS